MTEDTTAHRTFWGHLYNVAFKLDWINAGGVRTRYIEAGDREKPTVIMLHGIAGSLENFVANIGYLSDNYHVLAYDMVGTGLSDKPDHAYEMPHYVQHLLDFMNAKGVSKTSLVGLSLGSWVTMSFVAKYPEKIEKVVLVAPAGLTPIPDELAGMIEAIRNARLAAIMDPTWDQMKAVFDQLIMSDDDKIDDVLLARQNIYKLPEMKKAGENILSIANPERANRNLVPEAAYRDLTKRLLVVECPDAVDLAYHTAQEIKKINPDVNVLTMRKTMHWPQFENPDMFNSNVAEFLRRT